MNPIAVIWAITDEDREKVTDYCRRFRQAKPVAVTTPENERAGKLVEAVVGRNLDLPVDWEVYLGRDSGDFVLRNGQSLGTRGVKVTRNVTANFKLIYRPGEHITDLLALGLVTADEQSMWLAGYLPWEEFVLRQEEETTWGDDRPRVVPRERLWGCGPLVDAELARMKRAQPVAIPNPGPLRQPAFWE